MKRICIWRVLLAFTLFNLTESQELDVYVENPYRTSELHNVQIPCNVTNYAEDDIEGGFTYTWRWIEDLGYIFDGQILVINPVRPEHAGTYMCFVTTPEINPPLTGEAETNLIVQYVARRDIYYPVRFAGAPGGFTILRCVVRAYPLPTFAWSFGGVPVVGDGRRSIINSGLESILQINNVQQSDYGAYRCEATNTMGTNGFTLTLEPPGPPGPPEYCQLVNTTHVTALVECYKGFDGGEPIEFLVYKSTPHTPQERTVSTTSWRPDGTTADVFIEGLWPLTNYTLIIFQENTFGRSTTSWSVVARTIDGLAPVVPGGLTGTQIIIIVSVCVGVFLIAFVVFLVFCLCRKKTCCEKAEKEEQNVYMGSRDQSREHHTGVDTKSGILVTSDNKSNAKRESDSHKPSVNFARQPSWQPFKRRKQAKQAAAPFSFDNIKLDSSNPPSFHNSKEELEQGVATIEQNPGFAVNLGYTPGESTDTGGPGYTSNQDYQVQPTADVGYNYTSHDQNVSGYPAGGRTFGSQGFEPSHADTSFTTVTSGITASMVDLDQRQRMTPNITFSTGTVDRLNRARAELFDPNYEQIPDIPRQPQLPSGAAQAPLQQQDAQPPVYTAEPKKKKVPTATLR